MLVPTYWAEARRQRREGGRQLTIRRFGWSMEGQADAEAMAAARAEQALGQAWDQAETLRREPKVPYNGADGVPIREEVLERHGPAVITRNSYGAACLNSPNLLIADIDDEIDPKAGVLAMLAGCLVVLLVLIGAFAAGVRGWRWVLLIVSAPFLANLTGSGLRSLLPSPARKLELARQQIDRFLAAHPAWLLRLYRTPAGLRAIALHRPFEAREQEVAEFFSAARVDKRYARMCYLQRCFRARLTAKPWRIGIQKHLRPRPGIWPVSEQQLPKRQAWIVAYERKAASHSACQFESDLGSGRPDPALLPQVELHDQRSRARQGLPLA